MPRPALPIGTAGKVAYLELPGGQIRARALYRDLDGVTRPVARLGKSKAEAGRKLTAALRDRRRVTGDNVVNSGMKITELGCLWLERIDQSDRAVNTKQQYRKILHGYVLPELGSVRVGEATVPACDRALAAIGARHGVAVAKSSKAVLSGMLGLATRHGALPTNPVRDTEPLAGSTKPKKGKPKALTVNQEQEVTRGLRALRRADHLDLADLVDAALATGARIGELLAMRDLDSNGDPIRNDDGQPLLDLDAGTWEVNATVIRVGGAKRLRQLERLEAEGCLDWEAQEELAALRTLKPGLHIQPRTKTDAGWRILALPPSAVAMLRCRRTERRLRGPHGVVFGSPHRRSLRDPSNAAGDLKECLALIGYGWPTFHTFRKTVATRMKEAGCTDIEVADQLGHSDPSMTRSVYMGRSVTSARAAEILDRSPAQSGEDDAKPGREVSNTGRKSRPDS